MKAGGLAAFFKADVSKNEDSKNMVEFTETTFGKLNIMFNNAGISHADDGDSQDTTEDVFDLTMDINVKGVFLGCKYGIPALRRAGGGNIINTARSSFSSFFYYFDFS